MRPCTEFSIGNQSEIDGAVLDRGKGIFESGRRNGFTMRQRFACGEMGIGSGFALEHHFARVVDS